VCYVYTPTMSDATVKKTLTRAEEAKAYRARKIDALGADAYRAEQSRKRQERRTKLKKKIKKESKVDKLLPEVLKAKTDHASKSKSTIKKSTVSQQLRKVRNLSVLMGVSAEDFVSFEWLRDTKKVINFINSYNKWKTANSRVAQVQAISSILFTLDNFKSTYEFYSGYSTKERQKINNDLLLNKVTAKEAKNILPWSRLKNLYKKKGIVGRDKLILGLYTIMPPRRIEDVSLLRLASSKKGLSENYNYVIMGKKPIIQYNKYKTSKTYGKVNLPIPRALQALLKRYISDEDLAPSDFLFSTKKGTPYRNFQQVVSGTFKKYTGKAISADLLRHAFISDFLKTKRSLQEKKLLAIAMAHSVDTQARYDRLGL